MIEQLKEYKKTIKIECTNIQQIKNTIFIIEIKLEQLKPHNIFKYHVHKTKTELSELYQHLELEFFDLQNPFNQNIFSNITKSNRTFLEIINQSLSDCTQRIDIILSKRFIKFFSIHFHYPDYLRGLKEQKDILFQGSQAEGKGIIKKIDNKGENKIIKDGRQNEAEQSFERLINIVKLQKNHKISLAQSGTVVLDFIIINYHQNQLLIVIQQYKKINKFKNYIKTFFNQTHTNGSISIYKKENNQYIKIYETQLQAEPISMTYSNKTNTLMVLTNIGVYVYLAKVSKKLEELQLFNFIQLFGLVALALNDFSAQVYLLRRQSQQGLYVYNEDKEKLMKLQYKYSKPSAICFQEMHKRLFVSDDQGVHIYLVQGYMQVRKLHLVKTPSLYKKIIQNHGYLYCMSENGYITVIDLKPPQKQKLITITTNIDFPKQASSLICSPKNKRLILTAYRNCLVVIDSLQGPIYSYKQTNQSKIKSLNFNSSTLRLYSLSQDGELSILIIDSQLI